jgi:hypothetical protein
MLAVRASLVEVDALRSERTEMKLSSGTQEHKRSTQGVSSRGEREEVYVFCECDRCKIKILLFPFERTR